ncbi:MAG TPA: hypothetical protein VH186_30965 [Chloroflexia bacterium]|nr:hypothetical protein [Chloroflexia bacterium]
MDQRNPGEEPVEIQNDNPKGGWRRPLSYLLVLLGAIATFFSGDIARTLSISTTIMQFVALALLLAGAVLFFSIRERSDRISSYRSLLSRDEAPEETEAEKPANPDKAVSKDEEKS